MKSKDRSIVAIVLATSLVAAGCGGSSSSKPLARAELIARANAICRRVIGEVDWSKVTPQELPASVERLAALEEQAASELDRLVPPPAMLGEWRLVVDGFRLTGPEFRRIAAKVRNNPHAIPYLPLSNAQHERGHAAKLAGIRGCEKY